MDIKVCARADDRTALRSVGANALREPCAADVGAPDFCAGAFFLVIDPQRFAGGPTLAATVDAFVREAKEQPGDVKYPSEPEYLREQERRQNGIPVEPALFAEMNAWAERLGVTRLN